MADELMYIHNDDTITPFVDYNLLLKCLHTKLNEPTVQKAIRVPKVVKPTKKTIYKT